MGGARAASRGQSRGGGPARDGAPREGRGGQGAHPVKRDDRPRRARREDQAVSRLGLQPSCLSFSRPGSGARSQALCEGGAPTAAGFSEKLSARSLELLTLERVARLATADQYARPHVVPIVFVYEPPFVFTPIDAKPKSVSAGFTYGWLFDSHVLWKEPYVLLTLMAQNTKRMRLGTCVTNPATREPTVTASVLAVLQELSGGRMDLGIGRGDSARRVLGKKPTDLAMLEEATNVIRDLCEGREVTYEDTKLRFDWTGKQRLPVWIAGYGPKALELTGRIADGAIIQLADPSLVGWCIGLLRDGARKAGRDSREVSVMVAAPAPIGPRG